jgi:hypothetical protein
VAWLRPPSRWARDSQRLFPDICAKTAKWFRRYGELFRQPFRTKQWPENLNEFSRDASNLRGSG